MRVAVTGATGYLGAHTVKALLEDGHHVRLLVPPSEASAPVVDRFRALGPVTVLVGDLRATSAITELLHGADALVHAAGIVGTGERQAQLMWQINAYATEALLTQAVDLGLDPVVSVSSYSAMFPPPDGVITADSPTAPGRSTYAKTKGHADRVARGLQAAGAPVVVTYPSSVVGPAFGTAPGVTEQGWAPIVRVKVAPSVRGGMQMVDVRDVADVHVRLLEPGRGPRRYVCGGVLVSFDAMVDAVEDGLARPIRRVRLSPGALRALGRITDAAGRCVPVADGLSYEAAMLLTSATPTDDRATVTELGITWRCPVAAIVDSVRSRPVHGGGQQVRDPLA